MITQYIVSDIANPEFGSDGAKAFGEGAGEDVVGAVVIVGFPDEFREELAGRFFNYKICVFFTHFLFLMA